ncbi:hypothetical protein [Salinirubrum litoreum]|uniref:Restriction endonuclease n=1 Tax=Salinirubrum litoreum TaxID=1126234 RepID=A0ABD5R6F1_9EURY|nr:hypothetical protein [Salinirubrum litoreum]
MMNRSTAISLLSLLVTVFLIGIPTAATTLYPSFFESVLGWLPLDFIFTWMPQFGILLFGFLIGWYLRGEFETTDAERVDVIEGCIEKDDIAWKAKAKLSRGDLVDTDVEYKQICPNCQTPMKDEKYTPSRGRQQGNPRYGSSNTTRYIWKCPSSGCGHVATRNSGQHDEAENLFERHIGRIVESNEKEYSLQTLLNRIGEDEDVTPRRIWEEYAEVVDDEQVSTNCFH